MSIQTMKLALEALENPWKAKPEGVANAITALRQAIEQAEKQEPVAHWSDCAVHSEPAYPKGECDCGGYAPPQRQPEQEPVAYDKTELNRFAQDIYDQKMREGKHGHYESMFHVIHQCIKRVAPPQRQPLTDAVINAAREALDASFEAGNDEIDIFIPAHLAAALSMRLDEYDADHGIKGEA